MATVGADMEGRVKDVVGDLMMQTASSPMDVYGVSGADDEIKYLDLVGATYLRTVMDVLSVLPKPGKDIRILEIGAYQGIVARALSRLGFTVDVFDIPDILQSKRLRERYDADGVTYCAGDLIDGKLPFEDAKFDYVVICEVIEHLNFSPLPTLAEINRITRRGGYIYIGMPNQARLGHRLRSILGRSTYEPIETLFRLHCDPSFRVGLHWREYTMAETCEMVSRMGYDAVRNYYFADEDVKRPSNYRGWLRLFFQTLIPSFKTALVYIGVKDRNAVIDWPFIAD